MCWDCGSYLESVGYESGAKVSVTAAWIFQFE